MRTDDFQSIVLAIHRAALDPRAWQSVLDRLAQVSGGAHMHLFGHDAATSSGIKLDGALYDPDFMRSYDTYYNRLNVWAPGYLRAEVGVPVLTRELLPQEEFEKTEFYNDWIRPQGDILGGAGVMLMREGDRIVALGGNIRRKDVDRSEADFVALLARLAPHMRLALDVAQRIGELHLEREAMLSGSAPGSCIFLLSEDAALVFANAAGLAALEAGQIVKVDPRSRVHLTHPRANEALQAALRNPVLTRARAMTIPMQDAKLVVRLLPVDPSDVPTLTSPFFGPGKPPVAVLAVSTQRAETDALTSSLTALGLTKAEMAVAHDLVQRLTPREIAEKRRVSVTTVRNQVQSMLVKSGARRQAEFVALMLQMSSGRPADPLS